MPTEEEIQRVLARLEVLWNKLEKEGMYVGANTAYLAQDLIRRLRAERG